jgi:hypothetical protein
MPIASSIARLLAIAAAAACLQVHAAEGKPTLLPEDFSVYVHDTTVINHPAEGFEKRLLPTRNLFKGTPGGYVACYSRRETSSVYSVGGGIFVMGQIRMPGKYQKRIFQPKGYAGKDISANPLFKDLCNAQFASCEKSCWAGGDTGGWFGK